METGQSVLDFFVRTITGVNLSSALMSLIQNNSISSILNGSAVEGISNTVFMPVASVMVCIYFILDLMDKITSDRFNSDQFVSMLIKLVVQILIVSNATKIASMIVDFSAAFTKAMASQQTPEIEVEFSGLGLIELLILIAVFAIPFLMSIAIVVMGYFQIYSYELEFVVYAVAAPIGLADFISGGIHSNGMRYLRKLIALALQGGIMILILMAAMELQVGLFNKITFTMKDTGNILAALGQFFNAFFGCIGVSMALVGTLGTAKSISETIVGN